MQSNCRHAWCAVGKFWNFTCLLWNSSHSLACNFRAEFSLQSSHMGQLHLLHRGPLTVPSTGIQHSKQIACELVFGPIANGCSSKIVEPADNDFDATAYRPIFSFCWILKWFFVSTTIFKLYFYLKKFRLFLKKQKTTFLLGVSSWTTSFSTRNYVERKLLNECVVEIYF